MADAAKPTEEDEDLAFRGWSPADVPIAYNQTRPSARWPGISAFFGTWYARSMSWWAIAIPIIAKVLEDVPETITYRVGQKTVDFTLSLPFSWRLFYFSSVLLFLARLIYTVWCPSICKEYDSYEKFTKDGKDVGNLWPYAFEINSPLELASFWTKDGSFSGNPRDAFWRVYMKAAVTHENARAVALLLICLGILLSGIVLVQGFVTVLYAK